MKQFSFGKKSFARKWMEINLKNFMLITLDITMVKRVRKMIISLGTVIKL
jgi:hypothetical protein